MQSTVTFLYVRQPSVQAHSIMKLPVCYHLTIHFLGSSPRRGTKSCRVQGKLVFPSVHPFLYHGPRPLIGKLSRLSLRLARAYQRLAKASERLAKASERLAKASQ